MTKNGPIIQTISIKQSENQADNVLIFYQVNEKIAKANQTYF